MNDSSKSSWRPGDIITHPESLSGEGSFQSMGFETLGAGERYRFLISTVIPRPIALVSTVSKSGVGNLAPFSFFNALSSNPPCVMFSISAQGNGEKKHTLRNIEETKEFVINLTPEWLLGPIVYCAAEYPEGVNELSEVGLTPLKSLKVKPPRVAESPAHFECKLHTIIPLGDGSPGSSTVVIGEILEAHLWKDALIGGRISPDKLRPLGRLGGAAYTHLGELSVMPIPPVDFKTLK